MHRKKILKVFKDESAYSVELSIKLDKFKREDFIIINELKRKNIVVRVGFDDLYYVDEKRLLEKRVSKVKWFFIILIIILIIMFKKFS